MIRHPVHPISDHATEVCDIMEYNKLKKAGWKASCRVMYVRTASLYRIRNATGIVTRRRRRRSEVTSAGQCLYARILQFQHTITNTNANI